MILEYPLPIYFDLASNKHYQQCETHIEQVHNILEFDIETFINDNIENLEILYEMQELAQPEDTGSCPDDLIFFQQFCEQTYENQIQLSPQIPLYFFIDIDPQGQ